MELLSIYRGIHGLADLAISAKQCVDRYVYVRHEVTESCFSATRS